MRYQQMVQLYPIALWNNFHQVKLDFRRVFVLSKAKPGRYPLYMGIHDYRRLLIHYAKNQVCRLASDTSKLR